MSKDRINVTKSLLPPLEEYINEITPLWESHWITNMGVKHREFAELIKEYLGVDNIELLVNGHMALEMSLQAMELCGEVITTPFTFASTTHAIVRNGLEPVFCDINDSDFTIDVTKIESLITDRTCAILPVHVYGNVCDVDEIERIAKKYELKVIYDAAHAFGETVNGEYVGNFGDVSIFSFHATKVFNSIEGGAVCFRNMEFGARLYDLKNFGIHGPEEVSGVGANAKLNEFCAAMGICNLRHVDEEISKREMVDKRYRERLGHIEGIRLNYIQDNVKRNYAYFPILINEKITGVSRAEIYQRLCEQNIYSRKYFYPLTNMFSAFHGKYIVDKTPVALNVSNHVLTLPIYGDLSTESIDEICNIILDTLKR